MADRSLIAEYVKPLTPLPTGVSPSGGLRTAVAAILFDIYGTLFVSAAGDSGDQPLSADQQAQVRRVLSRYGLAKSPDILLSARRSEIKAEHARLKASGVTHPEVVIERIWHRVLPELTPAEACRFAIQFEFIADPVYPMPGLEAALEDCRARTAAMGIISNAQSFTPCLFRWLLDRDVAQLGFDPELVLMSHRFGRAKPSAVLFAEAARRLHARAIQPAAVLYVGNDMLKDIYPAQRCGFQTALYAGDARSLRWHREDPRCRGLEPDVIITDLGQLGAHLQAAAETPPGK